MNQAIWPPSLGKIVKVKSPHDNNIYIGMVKDIIWNNNGAILYLMNNLNYEEKALINIENRTRGLYLLQPTHSWDYVNENKLMLLDKKEIKQQRVQELNDQIRESYKKFIENVQHQGIDHYDNNETVYNKEDNPENIEVYANLLDENLELDSNKLFMEKDVDIILTNSNEVFKSLSLEIKNALIKKLKQFGKINSKELHVPSDYTVTVNDLIRDSKIEIQEGNKMINRIRQIFRHGMKNSPFNDLKMVIFNGYIYFSRRGIRTWDEITDRLVENLHYYNWQYNKPIDYDVLKYVLFQNEYQRSIENDVEQQIEAEKILSQEYLISLQPLPKYQIWCLKRLLMCWYGDVDMQNCIRKIKILINQYRADPQQNYNKLHGIKPSIVIYPKYGARYTKIVLSKIAYYFGFYINTGWLESNPSYFIKANNLVYYTNGAIDLKLYFRNAQHYSNKSIKNDSFTDKYTRVINAEKIFRP